MWSTTGQAHLKALRMPERVLQKMAGQGFGEDENIATLSSAALDATLEPSSPPPPPSPSDNSVAGKKHTSTPPPPPIPARSSRRPVSAVLTSGRKLFKSTGDDQETSERSEKDLLTTLDSTRRDVVELHGDRLRPLATGEAQTRDGNDKPRPQRSQRKSRTAAAVVEDIDREASNVCEIIEAQRQNKVLCLYTQPEDDKRANAAFAICCYMMLLHDKTPEEAYAHVEFIYPPIQPYRDAGCGPSTFSLTILDCLRGLRKGLDRGLLRLDQFDVKEYEYYENPRNGDFNWMTPSFIAFAAPQDTLTYNDFLKRQAEVSLRGGGAVADSGVDTSLSSESTADSSSESSTRSPTPSSIHSSNNISRRSTPSIQSMERVPEMECGKHSSSSSSTDSTLNIGASDTRATAESTLSYHDDQDNSGSKNPKSSSCPDQEHDGVEKKTSKDPAKRTPTRLSKSFRNILDYFGSHNVQSVIRLNDKTYDEAHFRARGIEHHDLQFPDGTCPPWDIVEKFLDLCKDIIEHKNGVIAVHCMAGLGRTGTLIGVYLMRQYSMTARETIAFLRLMRPGSVVGPQQNWLVANEQRIRQTSWEDRQEILHQQQHSQRMNPHLNSSPRSSRTQSPIASMMATPATDYEQVFSRANSEGLDAPWFGVKAEVDDGAMEVLEDEEESSRSTSMEETATGDESSLDSAESTEQDDSMGEDRTCASSELDAVPVHGPVPLSGGKNVHHRISLSSLESLTAAIENGSCLSDGSDMEMTLPASGNTLQSKVASEHIGSHDYVIPVQPRKAQPKQQQQQQNQHQHNRQGRREGSTSTSSPSTTSPKLAATSALVGDSAT
ncbi:cell division control protein 14 [Mortierella antarctica]|nr:cell division control protein 14 [Mortierella antarctica]